MRFILQGLILLGILTLIPLPTLAHNFIVNGYNLKLDAFQDIAAGPHVRGRVKGPRCSDLEIQAFVVGTAGDRVWIEAEVRDAGSSGKIVYGEYPGRLETQRWKIRSVNARCAYR